MSKIDYSKTIIYKLSCKDSTVSYTYIGNTLCIAKMRYNHKRQTENGNMGELYVKLRENGGIDNWDIEILEHFYECRTKSDANKRILEWKSNPTGFSRLQNDSKLLQNDSNLLQNDSKMLQNSSNDITASVETKPEFACINCGKKFTRKNNMIRHMNQRCKKEVTYQELEMENNELKQKLQASQAQLAAVETKTKRVKNVSTNNHSNNTDNSTNSHNTNILNNITNNNTINNNNNFNIISFGQEDFSKIFNTKSKRLAVLNQNHSALLYRIQHSRCNKKYPELRNVVIKNLRSDVAHVYKESIDSNNYVVMPLADVLELIVSNDCTEIETDFEEIGHELDAKSRARTGEFLRQMNENPEKIKEQKQNIKRMLYNMNRNVKIKDLSQTDKIEDDKTISR